MIGYMWLYNLFKMRILFERCLKENLLVWYIIFKIILICYLDELGNEIFLYLRVMVMVGVIIF